jgi:hypothetical protein
MVESGATPELNESEVADPNEFQLVPRVSKGARTAHLLENLSRDELLLARDVLDMARHKKAVLAARALDLVKLGQFPEVKVLIREEGHERVRSRPLMLVYERCEFTKSDLYLDSEGVLQFANRVKRRNQNNQSYVDLRPRKAKEVPQVSDWHYVKYMPTILEEIRYIAENPA